ncbi:uncharacterized protein BDZ99DRAFT_505823 [Mytilinidion resinicola]|uniref:Ribosome biogenesis protein Urb1 n=1 Tax=Mytilinidion resinicola TaxID=574789 RepID=A0A6A6Z5T0_9PEZI|nr:uncharacterized protein BDZ99DRAFT_505823 [Mytilinidion resinicola]KAF2816380.1 hypothetical protein BDZ99DRAFT_505823 [Mytilinidion resinicola]
MSKRNAADAKVRAGSDERHLKRQRVEDPAAKHNAKPQPVDVASGRELQKLLVFSQETAAELRNGVYTLKTLLDAILYPTDDSDLPRKRAILREYLDLNKPKEVTGHDSTFLPALMQGWSYASETNFDQLLSGITAVLALLLRVLNKDLDLKKYGLSLCKTVLHPSQARLFNRSLSAISTKEHIIAPSLRLLTEVISFDGGVLARQVFLKRDFVLDAKVLARNLSLAKDDPHSSPDARRPAIRTNAARYLLQNFKHQDEAAKTDLLKQGNVVRALFQYLWTDPPALAVEILDVIKSHILLDKSISRKSKAHVLTERNLASIASLYKSQPPVESLQEGQKLPDVAAHEFLLLACTTPEMGIMLPSFGWYPPGSEKDDYEEFISEKAGAVIDVGLESTERFSKKVPIRNTILADFAQGLRPYANVLEQELVTAIFKSSPELVADYFVKKASFAFDPKLTSTWIGYSAFMYSTIQLPVPRYLGRKSEYGNSPPPVSIAIESLLPRPLSQAVLSRCLNQSSSLVSFFALRILIVAFQKLGNTLGEFKRASVVAGVSWDQASQQLLTVFCQRCPQMSVVISLFRKTSSSDVLQREAVTRLLKLYYEVLPQVALSEKFDVSVPLCKALAGADSGEESADEQHLRVLELEHLVQISRHSPSMRWWQKPESLDYSPFMSLLKLTADPANQGSYEGIKSLLTAIIRDHGFLQLETQPSSLDALIASLQASPDFTSGAQLEFLDDCCNRFVKKPIKYQDDFDTLAALEASPTSHGPFSIILLTMIEQWAYKSKAQSAEDNVAVIGHWLSKFVYLLKKIGEDDTLIRLAVDALGKASDKASRIAFNNSLHVEHDDWADEFLSVGPMKSTDEAGVTSLDTVTTSDQSAPVDLELPPEEDQNHPGLDRWRRKDLEESLEDGNVGELLLCLCSQHVGIRLQAVINIKQLIARIEAAKNPDLDQLNLLLHEVVETSRGAAHAPLSYVAGVFAFRVLTILADPTHYMFPKVNKFLNKGPSWVVGKIPSYFAENTLRSEPEEDDGYYREVNWLLDFFIDALRTAEDMEIFRAKNIFERVLGFYSTPGCGFRTKEKMLRLLFRAAAVGGSTTLITRSGVLSWIQGQLALKDGHQSMLRQLALRVWETSDQQKVNEWSSGSAQGTVEQLARGQEEKSS